MTLQGWSLGLRTFWMLAVSAFVLVALGSPSAAGAFVYWGDTDHYSLGRSGADGQARTESFVPLHFAAVPCGIAVSGPYIYWGDQLGAIGRARIDGTGTPNLRFIVGATEPCGLTILAGRGDPTLGRFDSFAASWLHAARRDGPRPL